MLSAHHEWRATSLPLPSTAPRFARELPPWALYLQGVTARDGTTLVFLPGALLDSDAGTPSQYALAFADLLDTHLPSDSCAKITVLVDTKGVKGGANPPAQTVIPYLRELCAVFSANFPERLVRLVVYPVPWQLRWIWTAIKVFLDPATASKVVLLTGDKDAEAPGRRFPVALGEYVDTDAALRSQAAPLFSGSKASSHPLTTEVVHALYLSHCVPTAAKSLATADSAVHTPST